jgi:hypothetical protein
MLFLSFQFILAASSTTESDSVNKAYDCLNKQITDKTCSKMSLDEKIFSSLAVRQCNSELNSVSLNSGQCWPNSGCSIKSTAQAILALHNSGSNTDKAKEWLLSQNATTEDIDWLLQIDSPQSTQCKITYSGNSYMITIDSDKKLNSGAGVCLNLQDNKYWLQISPSCLNKEFDISCNQSFLTSLLFKKKTSSTVNVLDETHSASENGITTEKVSSSCFKQGASCNYDGTLWAVFALDSMGEDMSSYMPYLVSMSDDNENLIPESFLYSLTASTDFYNSLMLKQKVSGYWEESGNRYYDTALALYPLKYDTSQNRQTAIDWLLQNQDSNSCWESGNIKDTAWILYSAWSRYSGTGTGEETNVTTQDCESAGNYCMLAADCSGTILNDFSCSGYYKCCDTKKEIKSCIDQGGKVCTSDQECFGGTSAESSDLLYGQSCCIAGSCKIKSSGTTAESTCETSGGVCVESCASGYTESSSDTCSVSTDICCIKNKSGVGIWFWIFLILVVLAGLGIAFRSKLQMLLLKFKSKGGKGSDNKSKPESPSSFLREPVKRFIPRRILPPGNQSHPVRRPEKKSEIDEVLKKLKDMSK